MSKKIKALLLMSVAAVTSLTGCVQTGSTTFRDMSSAYRTVLEDYANDNVLLNIVRSSKMMPVSFLDMPSVVGTGSVTAGAGISGTVLSNAASSIPGFFSAAVGSSYAPNASLSVNNGFNFTQSSLDNAQFMTSFLSDITPQTVASLSNNQVAPKSILYSLVIDTIELRDKNNVIVLSRTNNPLLPEYEDFQRVMYTLIQAGLNTELVPQKQIVSALMTAEELNRNLIAAVTAQTQPGTMVETIKNGGKTMYQLVRVVPTTRMCLNRQAEQDTLGGIFGDSAYCNQSATGVIPAKSIPAATLEALKKSGLQKGSILVVKMRSTRNVFDYLGSLVTLQNQDPPQLIKVLNSDQFAKNPSMRYDPNATAYPLLIVNKDRSSGSTLTSVNYQGATYNVPADSASYTRQVLTIVSQLLTLNKVPGSIPSSPAVLIK